MNTVMFKIICTAIIISMLVPATVGLQCGTDNATVSSTKILIDIYKIDTDGHLVYNVTSIVNDFDNETILIHFFGSGPFTRLNQVDVHTELFIEHLPQGESGLFKTKDQVFRVIPIIRRPIVPFFGGEMETTFVGWIMYSHITIIMAYLWQYDYDTSPPIFDDAN